MFDPSYQPQPWVVPAPVPPVEVVAEPKRAGLGRRLLGWWIDYLIVMVPGLALVAFAFWELVRGLPEYVGGVAAQAGVTRLVGLVTHRGAGEGGLRAVASGRWFELALPLILAVLAVPVLQFAYQGSMLAWRGATLGKVLADTKVGAAGAGGRFALRRAFATALVETGLVGIGLALAVYGEFSFGVLVLAVATLVWWVNLLPAFGPRHRTLVDRAAGTVVVRRALYAQVAARTAELARRTSGAALVAGQRASGAALVAGQRASGAAVVAGQRASGAAVVAGRMSADAAAVAAQVAAEAAAAARRRSAEHLPEAARRTTDAAAAAARKTAAAAADAAAVAGQAARQGAERLIQTAPVQQALNSKVGQQSQALGAAGAKRARELGDRTAGVARKVGGRTQQLWQERQAARAAAAAPTPPPDSTPAPSANPAPDPASASTPVPPSASTLDPPFASTPDPPSASTPVPPSASTPVPASVSTPDPASRPALPAPEPHPATPLWAQAEPRDQQPG
ncbi:RDD family protein [Dactylosporangium sp. NPDC000244]|uniref:RDD family protein n=1 Tax=Dactylosporangium sp. NPDC000244 TaxID=3154365 RepID=UPI00332B004D